MFSQLVNFFSETQPALDIANMIVVTILFGTAVIAWQEYRSRKAETEANRGIAREAAAKALYREYLLLAFQHPELSSAIYDPSSPAEADRYDTFVSIMLYSFDEMLSYTEAEFTRRVTEWQVEVHQTYIRSILHKGLPPEDNYRSGYSDHLLAIIDETLARLDQRPQTSA